MKSRTLKNLSRNLRKSSTDVERKLWRHLRASNLNGCKFRRQLPMGQYIVDFCCLKKRLIIELDGGQHADSNRDKNRDDFLKKESFKILRFWNNEVLNNMEGVLSVIHKFVSESPSP